MNFEECISKLKDFLVNDGFNVLGYQYDEKQMKKIDPWFYMRKEKLGLPPACGEWMGMLREKYNIAAQTRRKFMGQWTGPFYVFAIKADGLTIETAEQKRLELEADVMKRMETVYAEKKTNAYELKGQYIFPSYLLMYIWENGVSDELYEQIRNLGCKKEDMAKIFIIDLVKQRCDNGKGRMGHVIGMPNPKDVQPYLFGTKKE